MNSDSEPGSPIDQPVHLLRTKLFIPPPHTDLVERTRLFTRLDGGLRCKLALVSAPAGFGKTTLISTWISLRQIDAAWVSLDKRDNDPVRFWSYFLAALQTRQPDVGRSAQAMLQTPQPPPLEAILTSVLNEMVLLQEEVLLVLDDYHTIENPDIHQGIAFLLEHTTPQLHLLIASRNEPPLPLPALRVRRDLVELGPDDLRFSYAETAEFLDQVMKLDISKADINTLEQQTEGWVAGLQLAALSLQSSEDISGFIQSFSGSHRYVFDYLAMEVLEQQPVDVQEFLLQSSILDNLNGPICDAVLERQGCQSVLEKLEHARLFLVALDQQRSWYRYHHLFSEFLRTRLKQVYGPEMIKQLRLRASAWLDRQGQYLEAIEQALEAEQADLAARLIIQRTDEIVGNSELITLLGWMGRIPADVFDDLYPLSITAAWAYHATGKSETALTYLDRAQNTLDAKSDGPAASRITPNETRMALAEITCIRANLAFHRMELERVVSLSNLAREYLDGTTPEGYYHSTGSMYGVIEFNLALASEYSGDIPSAIHSFQETIRLSQLSKNPHLLALSNSHLGHLLVVQGKLHHAAHLYRSTLEESEANFSRPSVMNGMVRVGLGNILYEWNELEQAQKFLGEGIDLGKQWANVETLHPGTIGMARLLVATGQPERALALLDELTQIVFNLNTPFGDNLVQAERAWLLLQLGEGAQARSWVGHCQERIGSTIPTIQEEEALFLARFLAALNQPLEALQLADSLIQTFEAGERIGRLIEILVIRALAYLSMGETSRSIEALERSLSLAEPEGYRRTFLDAGDQVKSLLARVKGKPMDYAQLLLRSFDTAGGRSHSPARETTGIAAAVSETPVEALSEREMEVLRLIAQGYSNQQIADRLYISLNTTKTHVKNILGRLQVDNRTQAAARARELGIL